MRRPAGSRLALGAVLLFALGLRLWPALTELGPAGHFDERFSLQNVRALLVHGSWVPSNAYYPSLSYLPHTAVMWASQTLHEWTGAEPLAVATDETENGFTATAYLLARLVSVLAGVLGVWLTYRLGRRIVGPWTGVLAALFLASTLSHVQHSALFKPDVLVVCFSALALLWSHRALLEPTPWRYARPGAAVGLAMAAKYTGLNAALPLALVGGVRGWRDRRHWAGLLWAGAAAAGTFLVLNPHVGKLLEFVPRILSIYEMKGGIDGGSHWSVVGREAGFLLGHHGLLVAAAGVAGLALAAVRMRDPEAPAERRLGAALLVSHLLGYSALYAAATTLFRGQNYLPVSVSVSVLAAWALTAGVERLARRVPEGRRRAAVGAAAVLVVAVVAQRPLRTVYHTEVPWTLDRAAPQAMGGLEHSDMRTAYYERGEDDRRWPPGPTMAMPVPSLDEVPEADLDLADAEVFRAARLEGPGRERYLDRLLAPGTTGSRIAPGFLSLQGPELAVLRHPWELAAREPLALERRTRRRFVAQVERSLAPGEAVSLDLVLHYEGRPPRPVTLEVNGEEMWLARRSGGRRARYTSIRFRSPSRSGRLVLEFARPEDLEAVVSAALYRWRRP